MILGRARDRLNQSKGELEAELARFKTHLAEREAQREALVGRLPAAIAQGYLKVSQSKDMAVVSVSNGSCGGCFNALPPQVLNQLRDGHHHTTCDNCGRIVIWNEGGTT